MTTTNSTATDSPPRTYLVTGASRGIGSALVQHILTTSPTAHIIASVRSTSTSTPSAHLQSLASNPRITLITIDAADDSAPSKAVQTLQAKGIIRVDVLFACHGFHPPLESLKDVSADTLREALNVNAVSVLTVFRAFRPLLQNSPRPLFVVIASASGSLTTQTSNTQPSSSYAISKVALHMITRRIHVEEGSWLTTLCLRPGRVATDLTMGAFGGEEMQRQVEAGKAITPERSAELILGFVGGVQAEVHGGGFFDVSTGGSLAW